ncbi:DUF5329 family protein [uncultured Pseudoteredinibacter sp.]|uniref:DUF5329 family protein n=1 Tax=uncultured Pseudoteredinibacter sp. TaxID=1641701 RepID=UPI002612CB35|nr:DUF5329 family protein [uncultured Pseudoteredinibacter sp.]
MQQICFAFLFLMALAIGVVPADASEPAKSQQEINHLLAYVKSTNCQYERNGKRHSGKEAVKHIQRKYRYFADEIKTAEDFIRLCATKSTMSGKYYKVHCVTGKAIKNEIKSVDWLSEELLRYRDLEDK